MLQCFNRPLVPVGAVGTQSREELEHLLLHRGVVGVQGKAQLVDVVAVFDDILQTDAGIHFSGLSGGATFAVVRHGDD